MIELRKVRLVNWYGYGDITMPIGNFTLIIGANGSGKSAVMDAVKYALYGDTSFNKASDAKAKRTVPSYVRGLLSADAGTCMRPAEKVPNVYTHIVLEMEDMNTGGKFVLGTAIDLDTTDNFRSRRYVVENAGLEQIPLTFAQEGGEIPYNSRELQELLGIKMMDAREGVLKFMQRTGLRLNEYQLATFKRKARAILDYNPEANIHEFIRNYVLEKKELDFSKLIDAKDSIDSLNRDFTRISEEVSQIDNILRLFTLRQNAANVITADNIRISYARCLECREATETARREVESAQSKINEDNAKLEACGKKVRELNAALAKARQNRDSMDCSKAVNEAEQALSAAEEDMRQYEKEKCELSTFGESLADTVAWMKNDGVVNAYPDNFAYSNAFAENVSLQDPAVPGEVKKKYANDIKKIIYQYWMGALSECTLIKSDMETNRNKRIHEQQIIDECNSRITTFSEIPDYVALKNEINREFKKRNIEAEAKFACEYVIKLTDEKWQDALESLLGHRRYTILVDPVYYDIADTVLNRSRNRHAHLFNTRLLMKKDIVPEEDSVAKFIETKNPVARKYFDYMLGRFHAVDKDKVKDYENAVSKEGKISSAMDSYFLDFDRIRFYCLGQETAKYNKARAVKRLSMLNEENTRLMEKHTIISSWQTRLNRAWELFKDYNYDAYGMYEEACATYKSRKRELDGLKKAMEDGNSEYMALSRQIDIYEEEVRRAETEQETVMENRMQAKYRLDRNTGIAIKSEESLPGFEKELQEYEQANPGVYSKTVSDYDRYVANGRTGPGGILKWRDKAELSFRQADTNLRDAQVMYNTMRQQEQQLTVSPDARGEYEVRKNQIWMGNMEEIRQKLREQTAKYEDIFKNEFVLTIYKSCETMKEELKLVNAELSKLGFKFKYEFDVKYIKDGSDYEKILQYARYLKEKEELGISSGQMTIENLSMQDGDDGKMERNIRSIINRIIESRDREMIERYTDYRNYMNYEVLLTNDIMTKARMSKETGYSSGAEVQIPYILILLSAMLMIYNSKANSTRLVFIDEPFAKMDPANVGIMLGFMKEQNLQMVFAAPDKLSLIGDKCDVVLAAQKDSSTNLMKMGSFEEGDKSWKNLDM